MKLKKLATFILLLPIVILSGCSDNQEPLESHRGGPYPVPDFSEFADKQNYTELEYGENNYSSCLYTVKEEYLEFADDIEMTAYDHDENIHHTNADVYNVKEIDGDFMVAVKYSDDDSYYAFINSTYEFSSFENLLEVTNIENYCDVKKVTGELDISCESIDDIISQMTDAQIIPYSENEPHVNGTTESIGKVSFKSPIYRGNFYIEFFDDNYAVFHFSGNRIIISY